MNHVEITGDSMVIKLVYGQYPQSVGLFENAVAPSLSVILWIPTDPAILRRDLSHQSS
jgi:hypothetical protein